MSDIEKDLSEARSKLTKTILNNCPDSSKTSEILEAVKEYTHLLTKNNYEKCNEIWKQKLQDKGGYNEINCKM